MSHQEGLFRLHDGRVLERIPWSRFGRTQPASAIRYDALHDGVWLGFRDGGVADFANGRVRAWYGRGEGLPDGWVTWLYIDGTHTLWVATEGGLGRIKDSRASMLTTRNGLPCETVHWITEDELNAVWLYTACGLVRIARTELDAWIQNPEVQIRSIVFDAKDGVPGHQFPSGYSPMVSKSRDGRIWFIPVGGVSVIDPAHLPFNALPPPIHIEQIIADGNVYAASSGRQLPALVRDLQIDYTALSLVAPEKNRFRVKLDGRDRDWQDVGARRQAFYTDLGPGAYRFRVIAQQQQRRLERNRRCPRVFDCPGLLPDAVVPGGDRAVGTLALLWVAYQLRIRQVARQFNRTLDARVSERTRIARDLHDTMLQSFQGLLLRFQSVANVLATRPDEARERLERALDQAEAAITEGRDAVQGLRSSATTLNDLANGIAAIGAELTSDPSAVDAPAIDVDVDGASRDLNPVVREEAYRIAGEALRNAFKHAQARRIIVTIHYEARQLRLSIRDDGKGMDEETMGRQQPPGHFGLPGMRERAAIVRGRLEVRSAIGSGTEIELRIPGAIAYRASTRPSWSRVFGRPNGHA